MNFASLTLLLLEDPTGGETGTNWYVSRCQCAVAPAGKNRVATPIQLVVTGDKARPFHQNAKAGARVFVNCGTLRHDLDSKTFSVISSQIEPVGETFKAFNEVILSGRCIKDIDESDARHVRRTADGLLIVNQTLQVRTGDKQSDLFNLVAINGPQDKLPVGKLMAEFTRKGQGLTVWGRLSTREWNDQTTGEPRQSTQLTVNRMTLPPRPMKPKEEEIQPRSSMSEGVEPAPLWPTASDGGWATPAKPTEFKTPEPVGDDVPF